MQHTYMSSALFSLRRGISISYFSRREKENFIFNFNFNLNFSSSLNAKKPKAQLPSLVAVHAINADVEEAFR